MKPDFKSGFSENILAMLKFRESMGLSTETYIQQFKTFDKYCSECFPDETELNEKVVLGWLRTDIQGVNVLNHRASFIRMFGKYLASIGKQAYILSDKFVPPQKHYTPYILSDDELKRLFDVIDSYPQNGRLDPLQPALFSTIFRLIYTCGLRPGEARTLRCENINFDTGEITIKETKKHKDRIVVMSDDMISLMKRYSCLRESIHPKSPYFFPSKKGVPYEVKMLDWHFKNFIKKLFPNLSENEIPNIRIAILMAAGSMSACSQAEKENTIKQKPPYSATADEAESRINTDVFSTETSETENAEKSPVSAFQEPSGTSPTSPPKTDVGQTSRKQDGVSENDGSVTKSEATVTQSPKSSGNNTPKQSENSQGSIPKPTEKPQSKPTPKPTKATQPKATEAPKPKPTEAPKSTKAPEPKPTEPPTEKKYLDYDQVVSNLIAYGQSLGMVYNGSLGIGNAGWFPPTDISGYTNTDAATAACYGDVDYVPYYYAGLGATPSDIMFNVVTSGGRIYVVYG